MFKFIELTERDGSPVTINVAHIVAFLPEDEGTNDEGTRIYVTSEHRIGAFFVRESYQEVCNKIYG